MNPSSILILDANGPNPLYESWLGSLNQDVSYATEYHDDWLPHPDCRLVITAQHYKLPEYRILRRCLERGIPTLIIADGILEYRNTWRHPSIVPGCIYQPVVGHKIACIGRSQARVLESWGNLGKCEVVGAPRVDPLISSKQPPQRNASYPFRLLIMTARTPGFTDEQRALTCRSIRDMKFWLSHNPCIGDTPIEPVWRLTDGLDQEIRVTNSLTDVSGRDLADVLNRVDAVLTTASTAMLEAMLLGLPVALLDYHGCPQFVPAAWTISAPRHLDQILPELINPAPAKMLFQDTVLHDSLECLTPAAPRMVQLVEAMLRIGYQCRQAKQPVAFPSRILQDDQAGHHMPEKRFNMRQLYPDQPAFSENDSTVLQVELELSRRETRRLRNLIKADNFFRELSKTIPGPRKLMRLWRESRKLARGSELHRR